MSVACLLSAENIISLVIFVILVPSLIFRIKEEERLLMISADYQAYKSNVKWRLFSYLW